MPEGGHTQGPPHHALTCPEPPPLGSRHAPSPATALGAEGQTPLPTPSPDQAWGGQAGREGAQSSTASSPLTWMLSSTFFHWQNRVNLSL